MPRSVTRHHTEAQHTETGCICRHYCESKKRTEDVGVEPPKRNPLTLTKGSTVQAQFEAAHSIKGLPSDALCLHGSQCLER